VGQNAIIAGANRALNTIIFCAVQRNKNKISTNTFTKKINLQKSILSKILRSSSVVCRLQSIAGVVSEQNVEKHSVYPSTSPSAGSGQARGEQSEY
jgi:hypothetical protein